MSSNPTAAATSSVRSTTTPGRAAPPALIGSTNQKVATSLKPAEVEEIKQAVQEGRKSLLVQLQGSNATSATVVSETGSVTVSKLGSMAPGGGAEGGKLEVPLDEGAFVAVPTSLLAQLAHVGDVVLTVATRTSAPKEQGVLAMQVIEINDLSGEPLKVSGLKVPIEFSLAANYSAGIACAYIDDATGEWSTRGVWVSEKSKPGQQLVCETQHLSIFGAIVQGALTTVQCSNFALLSAEGFSQLWREGAWATGKGATLCWLLLFLFLLVFGRAAWLDKKYKKQWHEEFLLVATASRSQASPGVPGGQTAQVAGGFSLFFCCRYAWQWCRESGAIREALDDILSNWFEHFAELRTVLESICGSFQFDFSMDSASALAHHTLAHSMLMLSRRAAGHSMSLSSNAISFIMDDEGLRDYLVNEYEDMAIRRATSTRRGEEVGDFDETFSRGTEGAWRQAASNRSLAFLEKQRQAWVLLHAEAGGVLFENTHNYNKRSILRSIASFFAHCNPVATAFSFDLFKSCKERTVMMAAEAFGALALSCAFFEAGGLVRKRARAGSLGGDASMCGNGDGDGLNSFGFTLGRFVVIATGSYLLAGVPILLMDTINTKTHLKKLDYRGSSAWKRQLRVWAVQQGMSWTLGLAYCALCLLYTFVFLANLEAEDDSDWSFTGLLAVLQDFVLMPLGVAVAIPIMVASLVRFHRVLGGDSDVLRRQVGELLLNKSNIMLPITQA